MKPHTINRDELIAHIESERWQCWVMIGGEVAYFGQSYTDAVNAYNQGEPE